MRHVIVAAIIGILTIGASVFILSDTPETYETEAEEDRIVNIGETFSAQNYDMTPNGFECKEFELEDDDEVAHGCALDVSITNTTAFEVVLSLDGDNAVDAEGVEYPSSEELTTRFIPESELLSPIQPDETATGETFFDVPEGVDVDKIDFYESFAGEPIEITL